MPTEIERKFLVQSQTWMPSVIKSERLRDGLVAFGNGHKVRVRCYADRATLTIKSVGQSLTRAEFEYEIPLQDAEELLQHHCGVYRLDKTRHHVPHGSHLWVVDVYDGILLGKIIAEIELNEETETFELPDWIGREITQDPEFKKLGMLTRALGRSPDPVAADLSEI